MLSENLVTTTVKYTDILKYYQSYDSDVLNTQFEGAVLGYVTPVSALTFLIVFNLCMYRKNIDVIR